MFPTDDSDASPPPSPSAPSGSPLSHQTETNQRIKRLEAKIKALDREARYHEEQSKRWEKLSTHLLAEREGESGPSQKLRRRGDTYKKAYLDEKAESRRRSHFTQYCLTCLEMLQKDDKDLPLEGIIRVLRMSMPPPETP